MLPHTPPHLLVLQCLPVGPSVQPNDATLTKCSSETVVTLSAAVSTATNVAVDVDVTPDFCKIGGESSVADGEP